MRPELVKRLSLLEDSLSEIKVSVTIAWIPGHQGIQLNDTADRLAKDTAHIQEGFLPQFHHLQ